MESPLRTSGRLLLLVAATTTLGTLGSFACGKSPVRIPIHWETDVDAAIARARREDKPVLIYFGASWDCAAKELEHVTFSDPEVRFLVQRDFVAIHVDATDDEDPRVQRLQQRFGVVGDPTVLMFEPGATIAKVRQYEYIEPERFARLLASTAGVTRPLALVPFRTPATRRTPIW